MIIGDILVARKLFLYIQDHDFETWITNNNDAYIEAINQGDTKCMILGFKQKKMQNGSYRKNETYVKVLLIDKQQVVWTSFNQLKSATNQLET